MLSEGIEVPTPWEKGPYDSLDLQWQVQRTEMNDHIASLQKRNAPKNEIDMAKSWYDEKSILRDLEVKAYLESSAYAGKVGAFEGAGYASTGLYRPSINCIMFTRTNYFCPVCQEAMVGVIDSYSK